MQDDARVVERDFDQEPSGVCDDSVRVAEPVIPSEKQAVTCRDRCMHCGSHCIYLNSNEEDFK